MIQSEALSRTRDLLNEASAGFWTDTQLYQYLDSAMNITIQYYLAKLETLREQDKFSRSIALEPLSTLHSSHATVTGTQEYALPTAPDYLIWDYVDYSSGGTRPLTTTSYIKFSEGKFENVNAYTAFSTANSAFYIRGTMIGFFPIPTSGSSSDGYDLYYYKKPTAITVSSASSEIPLKVETHEGIILIAVSLALAQNNQYEEGQLFYKQGMSILQPLN